MAQQQLTNAKIFLDQIKEDISLLQESYLDSDSKLQKDEYAFNYWVLSRLYSIDEELIKSYITEYDDKSIDCFAYWEDSKELYLIQNKYYNDTTSVSRNDVSDFLQTPLAQLQSNNYRRSKELQQAFNTLAQDPDAKIFLHFYVTNNKEYSDIKKNIEAFNITKHEEYKAALIANFYTLDDIYSAYYGKNYKENVKFTYDLKTINKRTFASLREEYGIKGLCEAYYIITPICEVYNMYKEAQKKNYPLFEENIREFLGKNAINNGIISTLKDEEERKNFLYYNNGITITCSEIEKPQQEAAKRKLPLVNPQIVNGCQTVNSIAFVLGNYSTEEINELYSQTYIMVKALIIPDMNKVENREFANKVVKYTNRQNAVSDKVFASDKTLFYRLQEEFKNRGFLLLVKPSDKNTLKNISSNEKTRLFDNANKYAKDFGLNITKITDLYIPLEKLLQVFLAFKKDGCEAFVKKAQVLKKDSLIYNNISSKINELLTIDNMIRLYLLFKRAEADKSKSEDKRTPIPYYAVGFLRRFLDGQEANYNTFFESDKTTIEKAYQFLVGIIKVYKQEYLKKDNTDYNTMIKKPIDYQILDSVIESAACFGNTFPKIE